MTTPPNPSPAPTSLTAPQLMGEVFKVVVRNWRNFGRLALLPMAAYYPVHRLPEIFQWGDGAQSVSALLSALILLVFIVGCHRVVLFEGEVEPPPLSLGLGRRELRYLGYSLVISLITLPFGIVLYGVASATGWIAATEGAAPGPTTPGSGILLMILFIVIMVVTLRFSLSLPAVAKDVPRNIVGNFKMAWRASSGGVLGMMVCLILVIFATFFATGLLGGVAATLGLISIDAEAGTMAGPFVTVLNMVLEFTLMALMATVLSTAYRKLVRPDDEHPG